MKELSPIARPLADRKLIKKLHKVVKKGFVMATVIVFHLLIFVYLQLQSRGK